MPEGKPLLRLEKSRYSLGDVLKGNCTSPPSDPPANITWLVNGNYVNSTSVSRSPIGKKFETNAVLEYEVNTYAQGKIKVVCIADVFKVYVSETEQLLDEEKPQIASVLGGGGSPLTSSLRLLPLLGLTLLALAR